MIGAESGVSKTIDHSKLILKPIARTGDVLANDKMWYRRLEITVGKIKQKNS